MGASQSADLMIGKQFEETSFNIRKDTHLVREVNNEMYGEGQLMQYKDSLSLPYLLLKQRLMSSKEEYDEYIAQPQKRMGWKCPYIIPLVHVYQVKQSDYCSKFFKMYMVYEFQGRTLFDEMLECQQNLTNFSQDEILLMLENVLQALIFLNLQGTSHDMIKASTIAVKSDPDTLDVPLNQKPVTDQKCYMLADAKFLHSGKDSYMSAMLGETKDCYLSPQQFTLLKHRFARMTSGLAASIQGSQVEQSNTSQLSNVFSLGMVALEMATLKSVRRVYDFDTFCLNKTRLMNKLDLVEHTYSSELALIIARMLAFNESERVTFKQALELVQKVKARQNQDMHFQSSMILVNYKADSQEAQIDIQRSKAEVGHDDDDLSDMFYPDQPRIRLKSPSPKPRVIQSSPNCKTITSEEFVKIKPDGMTSITNIHNIHGNIKSSVQQSDTGNDQNKRKGIILNSANTNWSSKSEQVFDISNSKRNQLVDTSEIEKSQQNVQQSKVDVIAPKQILDYETPFKSSAIVNEEHSTGNNGLSTAEKNIYSHSGMTRANRMAAESKQKSQDAEKLTYQSFEIQSVLSLGNSQGGYRFNKEIQNDSQNLRDYSPPDFKLDLSQKDQFNQREKCLLPNQRDIDHSNDFNRFSKNSEAQRSYIESAARDKKTNSIAHYNQSKLINQLSPIGHVDGDGLSSFCKSTKRQSTEQVDPKRYSCKYYLQKNGQPKENPSLHQSLEFAHESQFESKHISVSDITDECHANANEIRSFSPLQNRFVPTRPPPPSILPVSQIKVLPVDSTAPIIDISPMHENKKRSYVNPVQQSFPNQSSKNLQTLPSYDFSLQQYPHGIGSPLKEAHNNSPKFIFQREMFQKPVSYRISSPHKAQRQPREAYINNFIQTQPSQSVERGIQQQRSSKTPDPYSFRSSIAYNNQRVSQTPEIPSRSNLQSSSSNPNLSVTQRIAKNPTVKSSQRCEKPNINQNKIILYETQVQSNAPTISLSQKYLSQGENSSVPTQPLRPSNGAKNDNFVTNSKAYRSKSPISTLQASQVPASQRQNSFASLPIQERTDGQNKSVNPYQSNGGQKYQNYGSSTAKQQPKSDDFPPQQKLKISQKWNSGVSSSNAPYARQGQGDNSSKNAKIYVIDQKSYLNRDKPSNWVEQSASQLTIPAEGSTNNTDHPAKYPGVFETNTFIKGRKEQTAAPSTLEGVALKSSVNLTTSAAFKKYSDNQSKAEQSLSVKEQEFAKTPTKSTKLILESNKKYNSSQERIPGIRNYTNDKFQSTNENLGSDGKKKQDTKNYVNSITYPIRYNNFEKKTPPETHTVNPQIVCERPYAIQYIPNEFERVHSKEPKNGEIKLHIIESQNLTYDKTNLVIDKHLTISDPHYTFKKHTSIGPEGVMGSPYYIRSSQQDQVKDKLAPSEFKDVQIKYQTDNSLGNRRVNQQSPSQDNSHSNMQNADMSDEEYVKDLHETINELEQKIRNFDARMNKAKHSKNSISTISEHVDSPPARFMEEDKETSFRRFVNAISCNGNTPDVYSFNSKPTTANLQTPLNEFQTGSKQYQTKQPEFASTSSFRSNERSQPRTGIQTEQYSKYYQHPSQQTHHIAKQIAQINPMSNNPSSLSSNGKSVELKNSYKSSPLIEKYQK